METLNGRLAELKWRPGSALVAEFQMRGRLGPYEILSPLGSGGMGEVYRARDRRLDRLVAIKVIKSAALARPGARARFEREARAVAALDHPHICSLYDVGNEDGIEFLVMQYLEGETLAARLQAGPLPVAEALSYSSQIAHAIEAAHRRGITHRDLKPSNVMLTRAGAVLLDFGLAKLEDSAVAQSDSTLTVPPGEITGDGAILGTVRYMAPEVLERRPADSRSDLFSLGALVYEMVTGRRAFDGDSDARAIAAIMESEPPPLRALRPEAPPELETLVATCLAKNPDDRWQSVADVAKQIDAISDSRNMPPAPIPSVALRVYQARPGWMTAAVVGTLSIATTGVAYLRWPAASPPPPPHVVAVPCTGGDAATRAVCDGLTEALLGRLVRITPSHELQVTPQVGGLFGSASTTAAATVALGATHVLEGQADNETISYSLSGPGGVKSSITVETAGIFDAEERTIAWLLRQLAVELSPTERESLVAHTSKVPTAWRAFLEGRGRLNGAKSPQELDAAMAAFQSALQSEPSLWRARVGAGMVARARFLRTRDPAAAKEAVAACTEAAEARADASDAHTCLGMMSFETRDLPRAAFELALAVQHDPTNDDAIVWLGRTQELLHLPEDAEQTYLAAIRDRPRVYLTWEWAANFYRRQTRYEDAARALREVVALVPGHAPHRAHLASPLMLTGRYEDALRESQAAIDRLPSLEAFGIRGLTLFRMRRYQESAAALERAREIDGSNPTTLSNLARAYYWMGTIDARSRAMALYRDVAVKFEALAAQPTLRLPKADIRIALAEVYAKLGRQEEARSQLDQVGLNPDSKERPTDSHQLFFAALVYAQIGESATAIRWLERAIYWGVPPAELQAWPELDGLRSNEAFKSLTRSTANKENGQ